MQQPNSPTNVRDNPLLSIFSSAYDDSLSQAIALNYRLSFNMLPALTQSLLSFLILVNESANATYALQIDFYDRQRNSRTAAQPTIRFQY